MSTHSTNTVATSFKTTKWSQQDAQEVAVPFTGLHVAHVRFANGWGGHWVSSGRWDTTAGTGLGGTVPSSTATPMEVGVGWWGVTKSTATSAKLNLAPQLLPHWKSNTSALRLTSPVRQRLLTPLTVPQLLASSALTDRLAAHCTERRRESRG
jgi:hypothetical protein